jgi:hypothetical protein
MLDRQVEFVHGGLLDVSHSNFPEFGVHETITAVEGFACLDFDTPHLAGSTNFVSELPPLLGVSAIALHGTVSRRVVINPESDFSKSCFWAFCLIVNTSTKKTSKY